MTQLATTSLVVTMNQSDMAKEFRGWGLKLANYKR